MPFRERVKRALGRSGSISDGSSLRKTNTGDSSNTYGPGEAIPKSKYRGPVDPKHKEKLEGFSFGQAWRRKSHVSLYSPFGSRMPSRNPSRNNSVADPRKLFAREPSHVGHVMQNVDDSGDDTNVGGTRNHSVELPPSAPAESTTGSSESGHTQGGAQDSLGFAHDHRPFTEADVNNALRKSVSRRSDS